MGSILKLLFYLRTNKYDMLSDIKQSFLMVELASEYDKNRFCFFWKRGNKLVCYRYKTIVFRYTASPFMLDYVMKHHVKSYPKDKCSEILGNNFYVDNSIVTGNDMREMKDLYRNYERMLEGGFILRSWNSNSNELRNIGPAVRVFANGPGDLGSIPGRVIPKTLKMELDTTLLNTQHYKVRFKGKVEQSWEWSSALPYTLV